MAEPEGLRAVLWRKGKKPRAAPADEEDEDDDQDEEEEEEEEENKEEIVNATAAAAECPSCGKKFRSPNGITYHVNMKVCVESGG
jgi:hypothetical protein